MKATSTGDAGKKACKVCDKLHFGDYWFKGKTKCHCDRYGHIAQDYSSKKAVEHVNYSNHVDDTPIMFYACNAAIMKSIEDVWYVDNGCSNHMTSREDLLVDIIKQLKLKSVLDNLWML